jgi:hypothetical protein
MWISQKINQQKKIFAKNKIVIKFFKNWNSDLDPQL